MVISELIFVKIITNYICGEEIVMWRNFEKIWEILRIFFGNFAIIYALSCGEKLSPKSTFLEKMTSINHMAGEGNDVHDHDENLRMESLGDPGASCLSTVSSSSSVNSVLPPRLLCMYLQHGHCQRGPAVVLFPHPC